MKKATKNWGRGRIRNTTMGKPREYELESEEKREKVEEVGEAGDERKKLNEKRKK